jgi:hypothetical protein
MKAKAGSKAGGRRRPKKTAGTRKAGASKTARSGRKAARKAASSRGKASVSGRARAAAPARRTAARRATAAAAVPKGDAFGESGWQAEDQYAESLQDFSESPEAEALAAEELDEDLVDADDDDLAESASPGSEEEPEW